MQTHQKSTGAARHAGSNQYLGANASGENILPGKGLQNSLCAHGPCAHVLLLVSPPCLLPQRPVFEAHKRSLHCVQLASTFAVGDETHGGLDFLYWGATDSPTAL